ncbi:MAG: penicillin-binding protein [Bacteroidales bacterium]|nr:MAG: penicillin-binding protein [Bacteroidales bacterium]
MARQKLEPKKKIRLWLWISIASAFFSIILLFVLISLEVLGPMPTFEELENPKSNLASEVISEDHKVLGTYFVQNRTFVSFDKISPNVIKALIATEDIRFNSHSGIDARGLGRVFVKTLLLGNREAGGGSTITQQLAKNLFPRDTVYRSFFVSKFVHLGIAKLKEWITSVKLEKNYTKNEILAMYLNVVEFGGNSYGIKSAAKTFFNTSPDSLKLEQAAVLIGLVNAPTRYSPVRNPERSLVRRNFVLSQLRKYEFITKHTYDSLVRIPIKLNYKVQDHNVGLATYFRETLRQIMIARKPEPKFYFTHELYIEDSLQWANNPLYGWCNKNLKPDGTPYSIYRDGLKIYTTINSKMQQYAEEAVEEHLAKYLQLQFDYEQKKVGYRLFDPKLSNDQIRSIMLQAMKQTERYRGMRNRGIPMDSIYANFNTKIRMTIFTWKGEKDTLMSPMDSIKHYKRYFRAGFMAMNPHDGQIKAYVGGPNYRYFKYDHVYQGKRQVGSTIKPFLYTLAMQEGYSPCYKIPNVSQTFIERVRSKEGGVKDSTWTPKNSGNTKYDGKMVTLKWGLANSVNNISAWLIKQFTPQALADIVKKMGISSKIQAVNSVFLGTSEVSVYEMVGAYSTFANKGVHVEPLMVTKIEDKNGNVLESFSPQKSEAISEQTAHLMINLLEGVINFGTGYRLRATYELPGSIAGKTGTTQGHADGWFMGMLPNLVAGTWAGAEDRSVHFQEIYFGQGATMALPIYALFLEKVYKDPRLGISPNDQWEKPLVEKYFDTDCEDQKGKKKIKREEILEDDFF